MTEFKKKQINGVQYCMEHLRDFVFESCSYRIKVIFSCHCFTEEYKNKHKPDLLYHHKGEKRTFSIDRYHLSINLKSIITSLDNVSVYHTKVGSFFSIRTLSCENFVIFFRASKASSKDFDGIINVESTYLKPNMIIWAAPVRFRTVIEHTANGKKPPMGKPVHIKRK